MTDDEIRSRRERIATAALQGLLANCPDGETVNDALGYADALIAKLDADKPAAQSMRRALELAADAVRDKRIGGSYSTAIDDCLRAIEADLRERAAMEPV